MSFSLLSAIRPSAELHLSVVGADVRARGVTEAEQPKDSSSTWGGVGVSVLTKSVDLSPVQSPVNPL